MNKYLALLVNELTYRREDISFSKLFEYHPSLLDRGIKNLTICSAIKGVTIVVASIVLGYSFQGFFAPILTIPIYLAAFAILLLIGVNQDLTKRRHLRYNGGQL